MSDIQKRVTLNEVLESYKPDFEAALVDNRISFDREMVFALQFLQGNDYMLNVARSNPTSLRNAVLNIAATGLTLNPVKAHAYLVPRKVGKKPAICLDISYKGLISTATESGSVSWVNAEVVFEGEEFIVNGIDKAPTHNRNPFAEKGKIVGAYCVAGLPSGEYLTTTITWEEIEKIRSASEAFKKGYGPWRDYPNEMIKKAVIKRAAKTWPRVSEYSRIEKAVAAINEHEGIDFNQKDEADEDIYLLDNRTPEQKEFGLNYVFKNTPFRGKRIADICEYDLWDYFEGLEKKFKSGEKKNAKYKKGDWLDSYNAMVDFFENKEEYYRELEQEINEEY